MIRKWLLAHLNSLAKECLCELSWQMQNGYMKETYYYKLSELQVNWINFKMQLILSLLGEQ